MSFSPSVNLATYKFRFCSGQSVLHLVHARLNYNTRHWFSARYDVTSRLALCSTGMGAIRLTRANSHEGFGS